MSALSKASSQSAPSAFTAIKDAKQPTLLQQSSNLRFRSNALSATAGSTSQEGKIASSSKDAPVKSPNPLSLLWLRMSKNSLFASYPEAATRSVFARSQVVIWAVEGLAQIIAVSVLEDRYGVVQKNLSQVIQAMLGLQQVKTSCGVFLVGINMTGILISLFRRLRSTRAFCSLSISRTATTATSS